MLKSVIVVEPGSVLSNLASAHSVATGVNLLGHRRVSSRLIELNLGHNVPIESLKLGGIGAVYWDDFWLNGGSPADPLIRSMDLRNSITLQSLNLPHLRPHLQDINLGGAKNLRYLNLAQCPGLISLDISRCHSLAEISLGMNLELNQLSVRDSRLSEEPLERILSGFSPAKSPVEITDRGITHGAYLDLRGNIVPWNNRRIASKIRLLLCNNVAVAWSNNPPESVIPVEMYRTLEF